MIVFPNRDIGQIKRLKFTPPDTLEATFSFAENKVKPGEKKNHSRGQIKGKKEN
jgi:hypothetical protein